VTTEPLVKAWQEAGADLDIEVLAPYQMIDDKSGLRVDCVALVKFFGSAGGTVVLERHMPLEPTRSTAEAQGKFCSLVDPTVYGQYARELFVETLNDWGWFGDPQDSPSWYTGRPWTGLEEG